MRVAISFIAALLWTGAFAFAQVPDAGPDQSIFFPGTAILAGSVQGGTPLSWWTADGNGATENCMVKYSDQTGVTSVGPLRTTGGTVYGYPTDFARVGGTVYGIDAFFRQLYLLDPVTGIVTPIGPPWPAQYASVQSLAYDAAGDRLFSVDQSTGQLLRINRSNGALILVGNATLAAYAQVHSLGWRASNSRLYAVDQATQAILGIDPATGAPTIVSHIANAGARIEELEFVGDRMYGVNALHNGASIFAAQLQRISPGFGLAQNLGPVVYQVSALCLLVNSVSEDRVWSQMSGPGTATFSDPYALNATVTFSRPGAYVLKLTVTTTSGPAFDTLTINVLPDSTSGGWTVFTPSLDTRTVYVSSSTGNDANNGLSSATPKRTIASGKALLRNGFPDWLLLKCGDTWDESLDTTGEFRLNGRSLTERMLVSSYGNGARPLLRTGTGSAVDNFTQGNHVALVGLHFWAHLYTGSQGTPHAVEWLGATANFLLEDCFVEGYESNVVVMGYPEPTHRHTNVTIRRNVIVDAYNTGSSNSEGIFASSTDGLLMEENVLDKNGWNDTIPGSLPTWYRRNVYIQNGNTNVIFRGNIVARTEGIQMRSGGIVENNLFLRLPIAVLLGGGMIPEPQGVTGTIHHNVMLNGGDLQAGSPRGWGMVLANLTQATIDSNVIAHNVSGHAPYPVTFDVALNGRGVENTLFSNNIIYAWNGYSRFKGTAAQTVNIQLLGNKLQNEITSDPLIVHDQSGSTNGVISANNIFDAIAAPNAWMRAGANLSLAQWKALVNDTTSVAQQVVFPDSTRTIVTYQLSIGGTPTLPAFLTEARNQSKSNWRTQYTAGAVNDYIRAGYGL